MYVGQLAGSYLCLILSITFCIICSHLFTYMCFFHKFVFKLHPQGKIIQVNCLYVNNLMIINNLRTILNQSITSLIFQQTLARSFLDHSISIDGDDHQHDAAYSPHNGQEYADCWPLPTLPFLEIVGILASCAVGGRCAV